MRLTSPSRREGAIVSPERGIGKGVAALAVGLAVTAGLREVAPGALHLRAGGLCVDRPSLASLRRFRLERLAAVEEVRFAARLFVLDALQPRLSGVEFG